MLIVLALLAAAVLGGLLAVVAGPVAALLVVAAVLLAAAVAQHAGGTPRRATGAVLLVAVLGAGSSLAVRAVEVLEALSATEGTADPADPRAVAAAESALAGIGTGPFRVELAEAELQAVVQQGVADDPSSPIRRIDLDLRGPGSPGAAAAGDIAYTATFKSGTLTATGAATVAARGGGVDLELGPIEVGGVRLPGIAREAVQQLLGAVTDLNGALAGAGTVVEAVEVRGDALVVSGTAVGGPGGGSPEALTGTGLLDAIREQAAGAASAVAAPPEVVGPGRVDGTEAPGEPIVLALGDSLAAGVGVAAHRDGYAARVHRAVEAADGATYGYANLAVPGETTASLLDGGQLDRAVAVLGDRQAAYVLLDIGANDLLVHLQSPACAEDVDAPPCQALVEAALARYRVDLGAVLDRLVPAAGSARVALLQVYNPFSLGLDPAGPTPQEAASSRAVAALNAVAAEVAAPRGVLVADGFTPMEGTTAATTGMLQPTPDIHPNASGHDVLAAALLRALGLLG